MQPPSTTSTNPIRCAGPALLACVLAPTPAAQLFGPERIITTAAESAEAVFAADLDGDGDLDVLSASRHDDKVAWYENVGGLTVFGPQQVITTAADGAYAVVAADLDGDGDRDVVSASLGADVAWYENVDGAGAFGPPQIITTAADYAYSVFAADLDGDGDQDVLSASSYYPDMKIAWYENVDGLGTFGPQQIVSTALANARSVCAADLDGDGDQDVLSASGFEDAAVPGKVAWYENLDGLATFGPQQVITTATASACAVVAADLDGDGDRDVLSASTLDDTIAWYENVDGLGAFGPQQVITSGAASASSAFAADLDGDGDLDVLAASSFNDEITWYANLDGLGTFGPTQVLSTAADHPTCVFAADLEGDGDQDVLAASWSDDKIAWYENLTTIWPAVEPYGCGVNPPGSLTVLSGVSALGTTVTLGVDNPLGTQGAPAASFLALATQPPPAYPCGWLVPGLGMAGPGADGELLIPVWPPLPHIVFPGPPWSGAGAPASFPLAIPADLGLLGLELYLQGLLWDQLPAAPVPFGLTTGVALRVGA